MKTAFTRFQILTAILLLHSIAFQSAWAVDYPYVITGPVMGSLDVNTNIRTPIGNMQMAVNYGPRAYSGFNDAADQAQFRVMKPSAIRFPQGVWSNFYDWYSDGRRIFDGYNATYANAVNNAQGLRYGFPGLTTLHDDLNYDVLFTWNICYDSVEKGMGRFNDRLSKGFDVRWIELGNENFYGDQRSEAVATPALYNNVAQAHAAALKAADPNVQLSVPATWRTAGPAQVEWNKSLIANPNYYDAISVHKYLGSTDLTDAAQMQSTVDYMHGLFPGKPIWLSEWNVHSGGVNCALSIMGMANVYLYFFNHTDIVAMNEYFQVNNNEGFYQADHTKTSYGACYEILRSVFENCEMFDGTLQSTAIAPSVNAVNAEATMKDGQLRVFAINQSTSPAPFTLKFNGVPYAGGVKHETMGFANANDFRYFGYQENPLTTVSNNTTTIILPPLSLNVISGMTNIPVVASEMIVEAESARGQTSFSPWLTKTDLGGPTYISPTSSSVLVNSNMVDSTSSGLAGYDFELSKTGPVTIEAMGKFESTSGDSFWHRVDGGAWVKKEGLVGGPWKWVTLMSGTNFSVGTHKLEIARRDPKTKLDQFRFTTPTGIFNDPRVIKINPLGTTHIEAENFDQGGEGVGYHDMTPGNSGGVYRTNEDVDLQAYTDVGGGYQVSSITSGEWLQYPVSVQTAGTYQMSLRVACELTGGSALRVLFNRDNKTGSLTVPNAGGSGKWTTISKTVTLAAGKQMMRVKLNGGGMNLNWMDLIPLGVGTNVIADAGFDQTVTDFNDNGSESVTLNGASSTAGTNTITSYVWREGGTQISTGITTAVSLSVGTHTIVLSVTSNTGVTSTDPVTITVNSFVPPSGSNMIYGNLADANARSDLTLAASQSSSQLYIGRSSNLDRAVVFSFQLPDLGAVTNPFTSASFVFNYVSNNASTPVTTNVDLYGLGRRTAATALGSDYYGETNVVQTYGTPTFATLLQTNILTANTVTANVGFGVKTTSLLGNTHLLNYMNAQYAGGAGISKYIFLRLSSQAAMANDVRYYVMATANQTWRNTWPGPIPQT